MKKEVLRFIRDSSGKSRQGIVSIALTLLVISILLLSGPAQAVDISFELPSATADENTPFTFITTLNIDSDERVPLQDLKLYIGAEYCTLGIDGEEGSEELCQDIEVTRIYGEGDCDSYDEAALYGYGYGSADGLPPYDTAGTDFGYGYGYATLPAGQCSLSYEVTWQVASVFENTEYPISLVATATNLGNTYVYRGSTSVDVENVALEIISAEVEEPDIFYSFVEGNDVVNVIVETSDSVTGVTADFGAFAGMDCGLGSDTIGLSKVGDYWVGECDVADEAALAEFVGGEVIITAFDGLGGSVPGGFPIVLYSMTTFTDAPCIHFGDASTDFSTVTDFSDINFVIDMEIDFSCLLGEDLPDEPPAWMLDFEPILLLDFESVDMSTPESAALIGDVSSYLDIDITLPGEFGDSRIFIDSEYLAELDTNAEITIYHLPFTSAPSILPDDELDSPLSMEWTQGEGEGTLFFSVSGFSGYDITDSTAPSISFTEPSQTLYYSDVELDITIDGTGTPITDILIEVEKSGTVLFTYGIDDCDGDLTGETYTFSTTLAKSSLPVGDYIIRVTATDMGGDSGNTNIETYSFMRRNYATSGGGGSVGSGWAFTMSLSNEQFMNGFRRVMGARQRFRFYHGGDTHYIGINSIFGNLVTLTVWSEPQSATLAEGESSMFDVDSDGYYDVYVEIGAVEGEVAELNVQYIHEEVGAEPPIVQPEPGEIVEPEPEESTCTPSWNCGVWSECIDGERARICTDSNACGTSEGRPIESEACREPMKITWPTILLIVVIIAAISFAVIFFLHTKYKMED